VLLEEPHGAGLETAEKVLQRIFLAAVFPPLT